MYVRRTAARELDTAKLREERAELARERDRRNRENKTVGRYVNVSARIARRLHAIRAELARREGVAA